MKFNKTMVAVSALSLGLAACSSFSRHQSNVPVENGYNKASQQANNANNETSSVQTAGIGNSDQFMGENVDTSWMNPTTRQVAQQLGLTNNTIYFAFDRSLVNDQYDAIIQANADYLRSHPSAKIRLEGNTDPRGSREYNIGLGQRRSNGVEQRLLALGVKPTQITTVSYGEEKPAMSGDSAEAYRLDRRVNLMYTIG